MVDPGELSQIREGRKHPHVVHRLLVFQPGVAASLDVRGNPHHHRRRWAQNTPGSGYATGAIHRNTGAFHVDMVTSPVHLHQMRLAQSGDGKCRGLRVTNSKSSGIHGNPSGSKLLGLQQLFSKRFRGSATRSFRLVPVGHSVALA